MKYTSSKKNCMMSTLPYNYTPCNSTWTCLIYIKFNFYQNITIIKYLLIIYLCPVKGCKTINVIATSGAIHGTYKMSEERSPNALTNPVWKKPGLDYYFFNPGTNLPWMIGSYDDLTTKELQSNYYQGTFYYQPYLYLACCMQLLCVNSCL